MIVLNIFISVNERRSFIITTNENMSRVFKKNFENKFGVFNIFFKNKYLF